MDGCIINRHTAVQLLMNESSISLCRITTKSLFTYPYSVLSNCVWLKNEFSLRTYICYVQIDRPIWFDSI